ELEVGAKLFRDAAQRLLDVGERLASVERRLACSEQVQIRPVENGDLHVVLTLSSRFFQAVEPRVELRDVVGRFSGAAWRRIRSARRRFSLFGRKELIE